MARTGTKFGFVCILAANAAKARDIPFGFSFISGGVGLFNFKGCDCEDDENVRAALYFNNECALRPICAKFMFRDSMCVVSHSATGGFFVSAYDSFVNAKCLWFPALDFARLNVRARGVADGSYDFIAAYATAGFGSNVFAILQVNECRR